MQTNHLHTKDLLFNVVLSASRRALYREGDRQYHGRKCQGPQPQRRGHGVYGHSLHEAAVTGK